MRSAAKTRVNHLTESAGSQECLPAERAGQSFTPRIKRLPRRYVSQIVSHRASREAISVALQGEAARAVTEGVTQ